ncbi:type II secretory pathway, component PulD, partial [Rubrivivax gelatinosus]|nr:type II secretory pathway, component PulD [Rubrivivax gelatinosus]
GDLRRGGAGATATTPTATQAAGSVSSSRGGTRAATVDAAPGAAVVGTDADTARALQAGDDAPLYLTYNKLHNLLILRSGDERVLAQVRQFVERIDLPARQVLLEMRIIEVRLDDEFHRAFDIDFFSKGAAGGVATTASGQSVNPLTGAATGPRTVGALGNNSLYQNNSSIFQFLSNRIRVRLQLLEEQGRVQTVARPLLLASNNEPARLFIGEEVVLTTGASAQTTTGTTGATNTTITAETEKRNIGTTLLIHPRINADRSVTLTIDQESSIRVAGGTTIPLATGSDENNGVIQFPIDTVNTATVQAVALAQDGLTIAVGGMVRESRRRTEGNVPGLSSVPLLREVFKKDERSGERYEMVLVITPHVLESAEQAEDLTRRLRENDGEVRPPQATAADSR